MNRPGESMSVRYVSNVVVSRRADLWEQPSRHNPHNCDVGEMAALSGHRYQVRGMSFSTTLSMVKLADSARGGNSLKLSSHLHDKGRRRVSAGSRSRLNQFLYLKLSSPRSNGSARRSKNFGMPHQRERFAPHVEPRCCAARRTPSCTGPRAAPCSRRRRSSR